MLVVQQLLMHSGVSVLRGILSLTLGKSAPRFYTVSELVPGQRKLTVRSAWMVAEHWEWLEDGDGSDFCGFALDLVRN